MTTDWTARAGTRFTCEKRPATGTKGMVVTNHPLASAAGAEMLAAGGARGIAEGTLEVAGGRDFEHA